MRGADRSSLQPAVHLAPPRGWMNDPNGLCRHQEVWHAYYQHDPDRDLNGVMHWGHATSRDLVRWTHEGIALHPDELGQIYSGSVVVDDDDAAGFGAGAMVAIFTHHSEAEGRPVECQSLAYSLDSGYTWTKFDDNPVLRSDELDFRDPKVRRYVRGGVPEWVMSLAVGRRIEFYRSRDLRSWEPTGTYEAPMEAEGPWECPDLLLLTDARGGRRWLLVFSVLHAGPLHHGGTLGVLGEFDGASFRAAAPPFPLDHGPDFYAAQSFANVPGPPVVMGWLSSWRYAREHPSRGRRGMMSLPRVVTLVRSGERSLITSRPAVDLRDLGVPVDADSVVAHPDRAVYAAGRGELELAVRAGDDTVAQVRIAGREVSIERSEPRLEGDVQRFTAPCDPDGVHEILVDHGSIEVFADGGRSVMSALVLAGPVWDVRLDGDAQLFTI